MNKQRFKRNIYNVNPYEKKILHAIFIYATLPILFIITIFYFIFSDLIYEYAASGLTQRFPQQFLILAGLIVLYYLIFARFVFQHVNRLAGFYPRILKELDKVIEGASTQDFHLREGDYAKELVDRINKIIHKLSAQNNEHS